MAGKSLKANFVTPQQVAEGIEDGQTICTIGMTLVSASESNLKALEKSFLETGHPCNLTLLHSCGESDRARGIQHAEAVRPGPRLRREDERRAVAVRIRRREPPHRRGLLGPLAESGDEGHLVAERARHPLGAHRARGQQPPH